MAYGYMAAPGNSPWLRACSALRCFFLHCPLPPWDGEPLYPCSKPLFEAPELLRFHYSQGMQVDVPLLNAAISRAEADEHYELHHCLLQLQNAVGKLPLVRGYTHSIVNFGRVLNEGLCGYRERISRHLAEAEAANAETVELYRGLLWLCEGIEAFTKRAAKHVALSSHPDARRLAAALQAINRPVTSFYEAVVATNLLYYIDGCDDLGRLDQELYPWYRDDLARGATGPDQARELLCRLFANVDLCNGWNVAIGGTAADGSMGYNDVTMLCLQAARGKRRPNLALRLHSDAPEAVWDQALETISGGTGIPALYNEVEYLRAMKVLELGVTDEDMPHFAFGGCTELMIHGRSNVGSLEETWNLAQCFEQSMYRHLPSSPTFEAFVTAFKADIAAAIDERCREINTWQESKARLQPQPIRTLFVDDCIERGIEFNAGGARYNWSVVCIAGMANTFDSLAAVREVIYEKAELSSQELLDVLRADFAGYEPLRKRLESCAKFGNDNPAVDDLAADISEFVFRRYLQHRNWRGGRYLASCLMFVTYGNHGREVGATPDGRRGQTPVADSAGAVQGRDRHGPTALLRSVTRMPHYLAAGTLVVNTRFTRRLFDDPAARGQLKSLVRSYFSMGGMQLQINVVDQEILRDAIAHPEHHADLIIRVGGYSEYFTRLSEELQWSILERTEHR